MKNKIIRKFIPNQPVSAGWVLMLDIIIVFIATFIALLSRMNFRNPATFYTSQMITIFATVLSVRVILFFTFRTYTSLLRYTSTKDVLKLFYVNLLGTVIIAIANIICSICIHRYIVPFSIVGLEFIITTFLQIFYRLFVQAIYSDKNKQLKIRKNILIYGAGELGLITLNSLNRDNTHKYSVTGFVDDDPKKIGKTMEQLPIYSVETLNEIFDSKNIAFMVIAIEKLSSAKRAVMADLCMEHNVKILMVPPIERWINGELSFKQIKKIRIEDLLGRDPIQMSNSHVQKDLIDKTILITGAAGSIGSEIVRQIIKYNVKQLVLVDNAESPMYFLELELLNSHTDNPYITYIGDICQKNYMEHIFSTYHPDIVYHAAASKHVPLMEKNPYQAVKVNIAGTKNLADLSIKYHVQKFIMISTDKAVNPTSVMGASKRIAEIYVQSLGKAHPQCKFITTRFGNVLGSNGSLIPILKQQIEQGGPVTITHPEVTRFFMTIPEACELVLQAGCMGDGGEIYIFDMGKSIKIYDLAKKMISLSGLELGKDIQIVFTGLRPGEKLYEELLANEENTTSTQYDKIRIAKVRTYDFDTICQKTDLLIASLDHADDMELVKQMKQLVPEFKSQNSKYMCIDEENQ
ncbi:MAG: polysaccharide biosynthesis protein [Bacteroidales bacterium]|nr:polysaccharide biosynthesis protein [Bacteroidales bacterium]